MESQEELLSRLDSLLEETSWKGPPSDLSYLTTDEQQLKFTQEVVLGGGQESTVHCLTSQVKEALEAVGGGTFRLCSVGCGDGMLDRKILLGLVDSGLNQDLEYVGVGLCEQGSEEMVGRMEGVGERIKVRGVARDYSELTREEVGSFNCILMVSCLCTTVAPRTTLEVVLNLLEPGGRLVIVSSSRQSIDQLIGRFWRHQRHYDLCTTEDATSILQDMSRTYSVLHLPVTFDLSSCAEDKFQSPQSKLVLDHLMQVNMDEYNPAIRELVGQYLQTIASPNGKVESMCDVILIKI